MAHPKSMGMLNVRVKQFRMKPILYTQIRPFVYEEFCLADQKDLNPSDPKIDDKIKDVLVRKVDEMIHGAQERGPTVDNAMSERLQYRVLHPQHVLVRLRVDHLGFPALNQQRFGAQFVGKVANPSDMLGFTKKKRDGVRMPGVAPVASPQRRLPESNEPLLRIEDLVMNHLATGNKSMKCLLEDEMAEALEDFVEKRSANAIADLVKERLDNLQRDMYDDNQAAVGGEQGLQEAAARYKKIAEEKLKKGERKPIPARKVVYEEADEEEGEGDEDDDVPVAKKPAGRGKAAPKGGAKGAKAAVKPKAAPKGKAAAAPKGRGKKKKEESEEEEDSFGDEEEDDDNDDYGHAKKKPAAKGRGAASSSSSSSSSRAAAPDSTRKSSRSAALQKKSYAVDDDDDDVDEEEDDDEGELHQVRRKRGRVAADDDIDEEEVWDGGGKGGAAAGRRAHVATFEGEDDEVEFAGGPSQAPPFTGRSASSAVSNDAKGGPGKGGSGAGAGGGASAGGGRKRQLPLSFASQNPDKKGTSKSVVDLASGWD